MKLNQYLLLTIRIFKLKQNLLFKCYEHFNQFVGIVEIQHTIWFSISTLIFFLFCIEWWLSPPINRLVWTSMGKRGTYIRQFVNYTKHTHLSIQTQTFWIYLILASTTYIYYYSNLFLLNDFCLCEILLDENYKWIHKAKQNNKMQAKKTV